MSSITPPPTGGGNAKYVVIVVLLLGGIAGLVIWRGSGTDKPPPVVIHAPDANAPVTNLHMDDDLPPPPPPLPEAGPDTGTRTGVASGGGSNCGATKCGGAVTPDLESALAFRAKQAHACYDSALANDATLKGKVAISVRVASNGQVCGANVASNDMGSASVAQCVANKFRQTGYFPAPKGGCIDATVPITFVPGGR